MGNNCCSKKKIRRKIVLLLVGLDNAGKTVAVKGLAGERLNSPVPTIGFSVITLKYSSYNVKVYDLGGGPNIRGIWNKYFADAHGIIFVVDSGDFSRFNEVKLVLQDLLSDEKIVGKPLLLLANKNDQENALDEIDVIEYLNVESLVNFHQCPTLVQSCSATEHNANKIDPGIEKGYDWIIKFIIRNYESLNERVENDVQEQERRDREIMLEKIQRIKAVKAEEQKRIEDEDAIESYSDYARKLNGENQTQITNGNAVEYLRNDSTNSDNITDTSSDSFPPVYINNEYPRERPKSAVQIIKHQLQLNESRRNSIKRRSNKTVPVNLYGIKLPHSAKERRKSFAEDGRNLKSADDRIFIISNNMGPSGDFHKEAFRLNNIDLSKKLPPLNHININRVAHNQGDTTDICVIDV